MLKLDIQSKDKVKKTRRFAKINKILT